VSTIKAVVQSRAGDSTEVLDVAAVESPPPPGPGQVTIAVTRFPVHPGDLQTIAATRPNGGQCAGRGQNQGMSDGGRIQLQGNTTGFIDRDQGDGRFSTPRPQQGGFQ
jgi:hypothetical protein